MRWVFSCQRAKEGTKESPHFLSRKVRTLSGLFFKNFSELQQKTFFTVIDGLLRDTGECRPLSLRESLSKQCVYQLAVTVRQDDKRFFQLVQQETYFCLSCCVCQIDLVPDFIRIAAVAVGGRQPGQQDGEDQPSANKVQVSLDFKTRFSSNRKILI